MDQLKAFFLREYLNNAIWQYALALAFALAAMAVGWAVRFAFLKVGARLRQRRNELPGVILSALARPAFMLCFVLGLRIAGECLTLSERAGANLAKFIDVLFGVMLGYLLYHLVDVIEHYMRRWTGRTETKLGDMLVPLVTKTLRGIAIIVAGMLILGAMYGGWSKIAPLLAGLGVGGLAVALAAQDSIKNLFGSVMILLDRPFQVGDRVVLAGFDGMVEEVGFRSTKLRTLDGNLVTIPNSHVADNAVQNVATRPYIQREMNLGISYDTPPDKVRRALQVLGELLNDHPGMQPEFPPRVYFNEFGASALNIRVGYRFHPADNWAFMDFSQRLNMQILERFNAEGIEFAVPRPGLAARAEETPGGERR